MLKEETAEPVTVAAVGELEAAKALAEEYLAGWKRASADYANLKRESERERADLGKYAAAGAIAKLLPVYDNLKTAWAQQPKSSPADFHCAQMYLKWVEGLALVVQQFEKTLADHGVAAITDVGAAFDPVRHEAMMTRTADSAESGTVLEVLQAGYKMHERVLRPAKVVVAE